MASAVTPHPLTHTMHSNSFGLAIVLRNDVRGWPTPPWVRAQAPPRRRPPPPEGASHGLELTAPGSRPAARQASTMPSNLLEDVEHLDATESMPDASVPDDERHRAVYKAKACQKRDTICSPKAKARAPPRQSFRDGAPMPVCLPPAKRKKSGQSTSSLAGKSSSQAELIRSNVTQREAAPEPERDECVFCFADASRTHACVPCGHKCACASCASTHLSASGSRCPMCREEITMTIQIFD